MLLPLVWGHSKHLGFCLALSYISHLSIFKILSMAIFLCVSFSLHTHANPSQKKKKVRKKKKKEKYPWGVVEMTARLQHLWNMYF